MLRFENLSAKQSVAKRVELTTIWESDDTLISIHLHDLHDAIGQHFSWQPFEQLWHWNARIPSNKNKFYSKIKVVLLLTIRWFFSIN